VNPAKPKPYLSLRVELKDLGVYLVSDPARPSAPQISSSPPLFRESLVNAIGALIGTRHTVNEWRRLQDRDVVIALPMDLWLLANTTTTGEAGKSILQDVIERFPELVIVPEVDREPVLAELSSEVGYLRTALGYSQQKLREAEKGLAETVALINASRGLGPVNPERKVGDVAYDPKTGKDRH